MSEVRTLGEVCSVITKGTTPTTNGLGFARTGVPFLRAENIQQGLVSFEPGTTLFIDADTHTQLRRSWIEKNDVLLTIAGTIGRAAMVDRHLGPMNCNQAVAILRPTNSLEPAYLCRWLAGTDAQRQMRAAKVTATISNLSLGQIKELRIPLPPVTEQKRIGAILDKADAIRRKREQAIKLADEFLRSLFLDMFGDPVRNPKNWPKLEFEKVADSRLGKMLDGRRQTGLRKRSYLRNANVQWNEIDIGQVFEMDFDNDDREEFRLVDGDVLICEGGQPGRAAIWRAELEECYFQKALHRARPRPDKLTPDYLVYSLMFLSERGGFKDFVTSATIAHLTGEKLKQLPLAIPPIEHQKKFAAASDRVRALKGRIKHAQALDASFAATLTQKAFRGEL